MHALTRSRLAPIIVSMVTLIADCSPTGGKPMVGEGIPSFWVVGYLRPDTTDGSRAVLAIDARGWYGVAPDVTIRIDAKTEGAIRVAPASWTGPQRQEFDYLLAEVVLSRPGEHLLNVMAEFRLADHTDIGAIELRLLNDGRRMKVISQRATRMERVDARGRMRYAGRELVPISRPDRDIEALSPKEHGWTRVIRAGSLECLQLEGPGDSTRAVVRMIIDEEGDVSEVRLVQISGKDAPQAVKECILRELRKWKFVAGSDGHSRSKDWIQLEWD